jgi:hypothetical protein
MQPGDRPIVASLMLRYHWAGPGSGFGTLIQVRRVLHLVPSSLSLQLGQQQLQLRLLQPRYVLGQYLVVGPVVVDAVDAVAEARVLLRELLTLLAGAVDATPVRVGGSTDRGSGQSQFSYAIIRSAMGATSWLTVLWTAPGGTVPRRRIRPLLRS